MPSPTRDSETPDWPRYNALREQWVHEDEVINHRMMWLILSQGLLFTAYGTLSGARLHWLVYGFPFFGIAVAALIRVSILSAIAAADVVRKRFDESGLADLCPLVPDPGHGARGRWAAKGLPFVFGTLWILALAGSVAG